ncbi:methylglyoxal synthase [Leptolyngbya sp. PCC 6406]|uniref:methylglyoxal synthase n=1 Tax=Leptolyngbya sp. PCC 6406 TaxID=1173264 RepID=UPI0002ACAF05|nr:methylglyoxal synthase [Leptolyngbya sp. PCC 6406]
MPTGIALIAHDSKKDDMVAFLRHYRDLFARYDLIATGTTGQRIQQGTGLTVNCMASGPLGGDAQIAARVVTGEITAVFFFLDPLYAQPHEPDIRALLRICEVHNVPLATNQATAVAIADHLCRSRVGHLIFNPVSGQGNPDQDLALIRRLLEPQIQLNVILTNSEEDPAEQVRAVLAEGTDLVIASGGDGTVSAIAAAVLETNIPLGVIPRGTANAFASALGLPTDIQSACETILSGTTRVVDATRCNGHPLVLLVGIGFEAEMVNRANRDLKNRLGVLAYLLAGVQQFQEQIAFQATIDIDGELTEVETSAITIANAAPATSVLAQGFGRVIPDDGLLDVTITTPKTRLQGLNTFTSLFAAALINAPTNHEDILCLRTARLRITTDPPQKVAIDGEIIGTTPVELECLPQALTVFAPLSSIQPTPESET